MMCCDANMIQKAKLKAKSAKKSQKLYFPPIKRKHTPSSPPKCANVT